MIVTSVRKDSTIDLLNGAVTHNYCLDLESHLQAIVLSPLWHNAPCMSIPSAPNDSCAVPLVGNRPGTGVELGSRNANRRPVAVNWADAILTLWLPSYLAGRTRIKMNIVPIEDDQPMIGIPISKKDSMTRAVPVESHHTRVIESKGNRHTRRIVPQETLHDGLPVGFHVQVGIVRDCTPLMVDTGLLILPLQVPPHFSHVAIEVVFHLRYHALVEGVYDAVVGPAGLAIASPVSDSINLALQFVLVQPFPWQLRHMWQVSMCASFCIQELLRMCGQR